MNIPRSILIALGLASLAGLTTTVGSLLGLVFKKPGLRLMTPSVLGWMFAVISGIMVYISFDELIPLSYSFGEKHFPILGLIMGMAVMVVSLWLLM